MKEETIRQIVEKVINEIEKKRVSPDETCSGKLHDIISGIPVEASGRHVHLSREHVDELFGRGYELTKTKDISQPGQYLCEERVTLIGPKGRMDNVAVLGPVREKTQVEISMTDAKALGVNAPVRLSGDLRGAADMIIARDNNEVDAKGSTIIAKMHVHINPSDAKRFMLHHGQHVKVTLGTTRPVTFNDVIVRADQHYSNALHIDYDEANACGFVNGDACRIETGIPCGVVVCHDAEHEVCKINDSSKCEETVEECDLVTEGKMKEFSERVNGSAVGSLTFKSGTIITPSAMDVAREKRIDIRFI